MNAPLFRIGKTGTELLQPPEVALEGFARARALECRDALDPEMLDLIMRLLAQAAFELQPVEKMGDREVDTLGRADAAIRFALKRRNLLEWLSRATGCGPLETIVGQVAQARAGHDHQLTWHDDRKGPRRRLAVTINLSAAPYEGGLFEIRKKKSHEPVFAHRHTRPGTVLIFDVAADIQHRILPVTAGGPRRVFTGWFLKPRE